MEGQISIAVMGVNFTRHMALCFGTHSCRNFDVKSDTLLICTLPPSELAGPVPVTVGDGRGNANAALACLFTYEKNEDQEDLYVASLRSFSDKFQHFVSTLVE